MSEIKKFKIKVENLNDLPRSSVSITIGTDIPFTFSVSYRQMYNLIHNGILDYREVKINPKHFQVENGYDADQFRCDYQKILTHVTYCLKSRLNSKLLRFIVLASIYGNFNLRIMFGSDKAIHNYIKSIKFY